MHGFGYLTKLQRQAITAKDSGTRIAPPALLPTPTITGAWGGIRWAACNTLVKD
jgi:hypothetical protein